MTACKCFRTINVRWFARTEPPPSTGDSSTVRIAFPHDNAQAEQGALPWRWHWTPEKRDNQTPIPTQWKQAVFTPHPMFSDAKWSMWVLLKNTLIIFRRLEHGARKPPFASNGGLMMNRRRRWLVITCGRYCSPSFLAVGFIFGGSGCRSDPMPMCR